LSKNILKVMTCGNIDDGKSTLLGRLLFETENIFDDQIEKVTKNFDSIDYSLFFDGLIDEKKQGITIDIAHKYAIIENRKFIFIDSPGHEEFTKNTANAATFADFALLVIDINRGITPQFKNHLEIISKFKNINDIVICINKIDKVGYSSSKINSLIKEIEVFSNKNSIKIANIIPLSGLLGDNVIKRSNKTKFYKGLTLIDTLLNLEFKKIKKINNTLLPISFQSKEENEKRVYFTRSINGSLKNKDELINLKTNQKVTVSNIYSDLEKKEKVLENKNVSLSFKQEISISSEDILAKNTKGIYQSDAVKASIFLIDSKSLVKNKNYRFQFYNQSSDGFFSKISFNEFSVNVVTATVELKDTIIVSSQSEIIELSRFLVLDKNNNKTIGFGTIDISLDRGSHIKQQQLQNISTESGKCFWFSGLSGSGKTTLGKLFVKEITKKNIRFVHLDGDNLRKSINKGLGFSQDDILEAQRRTAEMVKLLSENGINTLVSTISPFKSGRESAKELLEKNYFEVYIEASLEECIKRDPKNIYKEKKIQNMIGRDTLYEIPDNPDITLNTEKHNEEFLVSKLIDFYNKC
jgi:bifunctional enzyme CysN/CysC